MFYAICRMSGLSRLFAAIVAVALLSGAPPASAQTLHAILIADTNDASIGVSVKKDFEGLKRLVTAVSGYTGMQLSLQALEGAQVTLANVRGAVNNVKAGPDDAILFYYSGHGFRTWNKTSRFPYLYISNQGQDFTEIVAELRKKAPRLLIAVTDSCNNVMDLPVAQAMMMRSAPPDYKKTYSRLWRDAAGEVVIASSSEGEYAWGDDDAGGFFTKRFLASHETQVNITSPTTTPGWEQIVNTAKTPITTNYGGTAYKQTPIVESKVSYVRAYVPGGLTATPVQMPAAPPPQTPTAAAPAPAPAPATAPAKLAWVPGARGTPIPPSAVVAGQEGGKPVGICRAPYNNGIHPGKLGADGICSIGWGGRAVRIERYEVLTGTPQVQQAAKWVAARGGQSATGAFVGGQETGRQLVVCRAASGANNVVPGKLVAQFCNIANGVAEVQVPQYEVLVAQ
ncbi:MAG TPA: DM9 repeat-containing protein [Alphaproteobacteria bacterium]|nr:DM9 repeat-containing protein [Alphaproteobacteria bacterium]